jgi:hypothetical protein
MATALQFPAAAVAAAGGDEPVLIGGPSLMSLHTRLGALKERHAALEMRIFDEDQRPRPDSETLSRLKIEKLHIKEEMEKIRVQVN